jgi:Leucine-rich repeat (LRR) protein
MESVSNGSLVGLRMLRELDMSGNQLGQLTPLAFQSLDQLIMLNLSSCAIRLDKMGQHSEVVSDLK